MNFYRCFQKFFLLSLWKVPKKVFNTAFVCQATLEKTQKQGAKQGNDRKEQIVLSTLRRLYFYDH